MAASEKDAVQGPGCSSHLCSNLGKSQESPFTSSVGNVQNTVSDPSFYSLWALSSFNC